MPPSPCKVCGSANHWDKECPDWNVYFERAKRSANVAELWSENESEKAYTTAYSVLLNEKLTETVVDESHMTESLSQQQDFRAALLLAQVNALGAIPDALTTELSSLVGFNHTMNFMYLPPQIMVTSHPQRTIQSTIDHQGQPNDDSATTT